MLLVLSNGMDWADLATTIEGMKESSKSAGSHKRRVLYWEGYSAMIAKTTSMEGKAHVFVRFFLPNAEADPTTDGTVDIVELTKRQKGLIASVGDTFDIMGKKMKPPEDSTNPKSWAIAWNEDDSQMVWQDLHTAEPCIYLTSSAVYTATRFKRAMCKTITSMPKTAKELEGRVSEITSNADCIKSISFAGHTPATVNAYNFFLVGSIAPALMGALPDDIGHITSSDNADIYEYFLKRHSKHLLTEADKLIGQMKTDIAKSLMPLVVASSMKDAGVARRNSLMKKVYIHESKKAFIKNVRGEGDGLEMHVIRGDMGDSEFGKYGGVVFEMFYRADLSVFG